MKTELPLTETYPDIPIDNATRRWQANWDNPAEDHWVVRTESFVGTKDFYSYSDDYTRTVSWLSERLYFSMQLGQAIEKGFKNSEALLTIRPCNNTRAFRRSVKLSHYFSYRSLAAEERLSRTIDDPADLIAGQVLEPIYRRLLFMKEDHRPSHFLLSYDDDCSLLGSVASHEDSRDFYSAYCRAKGLIELGHELP